MPTPRTPDIDPHLVAGLSGQFAALGDQFRRLSGELNALHWQLAAQRPTPPNHGGPVPGFAGPGVAGPGFAGPGVAGPGVSSGFSAPVQPPVGPPAAPAVTVPWWQRDGVISRVLAVAGSVVTLVGVVMLLVLAAQAGWFGPVLRVGAGAALSVVLVYIGSRLFTRPGGRVGGIAVAATGVAGLYLCIVAATVIYEWLEPVLGLFAAFGIAAAGIWLAVAWRSQAMAVLILAGVALCAPVTAGGITLALLCFFTVTFLASFAAQLGRDWPILAAARTLPVVVVALIAIARAATTTTSTSSTLALLAVASIVASFGIGSSALLLQRNAHDVMATVLMGVASIPVLTVSVLFQPWAASVLEAAVASIAVLTILLASWLPVHAKAVVAAVGSIALLQAVLVPTAVDMRPLALLVVAIVVLTAANRIRSTMAYIVAAAFGSFGALGFVVVAPISAVTDARYASGDLGVALAGILLVTVSVGLVVVAANLSIASDNLEGCWIIAGIVSMYAATIATVTLGVAALGGTTGFVAGHCAATIEWMAAAMALLALGLRNEKYAHSALLAGLSLTTASVAKLFLFDLGALDGMFRVGAFIIVGLLLLFAGTRYASRFRT